MAERIIKKGSFLKETIKPEDIFIPEELNVNQKLIAQILEDFLRGEVEPRIKELEAKTEGSILELLKKGASMGWQGVDVPKEFGGFGLDKITSSVVTEQASIGGPFGLANMIHTAFGTLPILYFGNREQKTRYLSDLAKGKKIGAFALTEPDAGTDALNARTTATLSEDGHYYILNGTKQFISNSGYADVFITFAKINGETFTAFIVDRDFKGISFGEEEDKMGIRGTSTRSVTLENVKVPIKNLLLQPGQGSSVAFSTLNIGRHKIGAACVGAAKQALKDSIAYAKTRTQFGQSISNFGLIKEKLGEMAIRIFAGESVIYRTAGLLENGLKDMVTSEENGPEWAHRIGEYAAECSISKICASEMLNYVVDEAVQIHGGYGYIKDYPVERYYRDARINRIFGGTNEINRLLILRMFLKGTKKDQLPLISDMEEAAEPKVSAFFWEAHSQGNGLGELAYLVKNTKRIALLSLTAVFQAFPDSMDHQQELMGMLSNIIIEAFAMESCLLRTHKINQKFGEEKGEISNAISQVYILDAFMRVERWAMLIYAAISKGDTLKGQLSSLRGLMTQYIPVNSVVLRRKIANYMIKAGRYFIL